VTDIPISTVTDAMTAPPAAPRRTDQLDKDAFMRLLVAQLKYQNPLSPSDPNQFMAQTAQFTMVEKLEAMAADNARIRALGESTTATALLGRQITWLDASGTEQTGVVTGTAFGTAGATLTVGDQRVPLDRVSGVRTTTPATPATTPAPTQDPEAEAPDAMDGTDGTTSTTTVPTEPSAEEA